MKILIAPLHYIISDESGSEYTRALDNLRQIAKDSSFSGDVLVGYSDLDHIGNFKIHKIFNKKPQYITVFRRLLFVVQVFIKSLRLMHTQTYDCLWHHGPFAIDESFSLLALWNNSRIRFVIGPIYTPHDFKGVLNHGSYQRNADGTVKELNIWNKLNVLIYRSFSKTFKNLSLKTLQIADQVITIDTHGQRMLSEKNISSVKSIGITIPTDSFNHPPRPRPVKFFHLLNVSYLVERKRTEDLIEAVNILIKKHGFTDLKLNIVGDGPQKFKLKSLVEKKSLGRYVNFTGFVPRTKVSKYYMDADIFVSGSVSDIMPAMYFEAMSASLPMVIVRNSTALDLEKNHFGGLVVEQKDPEAMAAAILKLMTEKNIYTKFSKQNHDLMQTTYNFDQAINELKKTFYA